MKTFNQEQDRAEARRMYRRELFASEETRNFDLSEGAEDGFCKYLPEDDHLRELLGMAENSAVQEILQAALFNPLKELTFARGKRVRARLVELAHRLVDESATPPVISAQQCRSCAEVVELIHAGSLVIDDIEDGSHMRRGRPALHVRFGLPIALNAGNWLYFWPFQMLKRLQLPDDQLLFLYEHCHQTLLRAHFGQALDLGTRVEALPQDQVSRACMSSMKLKTGALMGFALALGGLAAGARKSVIRVLDEFGTDLGVALQMFDDLGNLTSRREPSKRYEDLMLYRPSWAWACAADHSLPREYENFVTAVSKLPHTAQVDLWLEKHRLLEVGRRRARHHMEIAFKKLEMQLNAEQICWSRDVFEELRELGEGIAIAYE